MSLDLNNSYKAILAAARRGKFITYSDVPAASRVEWKKGRRPIPLHLDQLLKISHDRLIERCMRMVERVNQART